MEGQSSKSEKTVFWLITVLFIKEILIRKFMMQAVTVYGLQEKTLQKCGNLTRKAE